MAEPVAYSNPSMTPADVEQKRKLAAALMQQGSDASPVQHWTQGLARVLQGGFGGYYGGQASQGEKEGIASRGAFMQQAMQNPQAAAASGASNPWTTDQASQIGQKVIGQKLEQSSPAYQMDLKLKQGKVDMLPLERQHMQGTIAGQGLQQQMTQAQLQQFKLATPDARHAAAIQYGLTPGSREYQSFVLMGQFPSKDGGESTIDKEVAKARVEMAQKDINAGVGAQQTQDFIGKLDQIANAPGLKAAIGPLQGGVVGQTAGSLVPFSQQLGLSNPRLNAEIRRLQSQLELAGGQQMKGLGAQSDSDAARLSGAISNLTEARNPQEFKDALAIIRQSIVGAVQRGQSASKEFPSLGQGRINPAAPQPTQGGPADPLGIR